MLSSCAFDALMSPDRPPVPPEVEPKVLPDDVVVVGVGFVSRCAWDMNELLSMIMMPFYESDLD